MEYHSWEKMGIQDPDGPGGEYQIGFQLVASVINNAVSWQIEAEPMDSFSPEKGMPSIWC